MELQYQQKLAKRNRIKRLIRENYRLLENELNTGYNIVFLWNKKDLVENASFHIIQHDMKQLLKRVDVLKWKKYSYFY